MKNYEMPIIELNNDFAEGVYAASGTLGYLSETTIYIYSSGIPVGTEITVIYSDGTSEMRTYTANGIAYSESEIEKYKMITHLVVNGTKNPYTPNPEYF